MAKYTFILLKKYGKTKSKIYICENNLKNTFKKSMTKIKYIYICKNNLKRYIYIFAKTI
jgi:hypothetical protein